MRYTRIFLAAVSLLWAGVALRAGELESNFIELRLFSGRILRGALVQDDGREIILCTAEGQRRIYRTDVVEFRRQFTPEERASLLRSLAPTAAEAPAAAPKPVDTPKAEVPVIARREAPPEAPTGLTVARSASSAPLVGSPGQQLDWVDRMARGLNRTVSVEFNGESLAEALTMMSAVTGLNIIVDPKLRAKDLKVNLQVRAMDAANVLKWLAKLTDTYMDLADQAIFFTDKPPAGEDDEDRIEATLLLSQVNGDMTLIPPPGQPMTNADCVKIAMEVWEKSNPKPTDFPAPEMQLERFMKTFSFVGQNP
jgi:hypothetical protein